MTQRCQYHDILTLSNRMAFAGKLDTELLKPPPNVNASENDETIQSPEIPAVTGSTAVEVPMDTQYLAILNLEFQGVKEGSLANIVVDVQKAGGFARAWQLEADALVMANSTRVTI